MKNGLEKILLSAIVEDTNDNSVEVISENNSPSYLESVTLNKIKKLSVNMVGCFFQFGCELLKAKEFCQFVFNIDKGRECKNIYEWAEYRLSFKKTTTATLIGICERFGCFDDFGVRYLNDIYSGFSFSQLAEMLSIPDELLSFISKDMTVREIREFKAIQKSVPTSEQKTESTENKGIQRFIVLKNDTERIDFLKNFSNWGLWFEENRLGIKYYRCMLNNGDYIIASVPNPYYFYDNKLVYPSPNFKIIKSGTDKDNARYNFYFNSDAEILTYLRNTKAKFVEDFWGDKAREHKKHIEEFQEQSKMDSNLKYRKVKSIKKAIEKEMNYIGSLKGVNNEE